MGMFDYLRSSYDLGEPFTNTECHTKDIEDGIGGTMTEYWLDPAGYLYEINYSETADFQYIDEYSEGYDVAKIWTNFKWVPNGKHGKVKPVYLTKYIEIYTADYEGKWEHWPRCRLHFRAGKLMDFLYLTEHE